MKKLACLFLLLTAVSLQIARAADWRMHPTGSRLEFTASFEKTPAPGVFKDFDVRFQFDPAQPAGGRLDVTIKVASADMASADINRAIAAAEWFDFARHAQAEFQATDIQRLPGEGNDKRYVARGTLALKGVRQAVEVPFTWTAANAGATMEGEFVVKRSAFGIGTGEWVATDVIGPDVTVKFRVRLREGT